MKECLNKICKAEKNQSYKKQYKQKKLGRSKTGKQVGATHLLKSNKLWCHLVEHKSYLKVY